MNSFESSGRATGAIKKLVADKSFGFIAADRHNKDLFFHSNELLDVAFAELREGDHVSFEVADGPKGPTALNVGRNGHQIDEEQTDHIDEDIGKEVRIAFGNLNSQLAEMIARNPSALKSLEWRDLERLVAEVFVGIGFQVELTPGSKDGGKDVVVACIVSGETRSYVIEIKHWRSGKRVGAGTVAEFLHVIARENRDGGLFLATHGYGKNAFESLTEIDRQRVRFGAEEKVVGLCRQYVRAQEGIWSLPEQLEKVIFEDTV